MKTLYYTILVFSVIFFFPVFPFADSAFLVCVFLFFHFVSNSKYRRNVKLFFNSKLVIKLYLSIIALIAWLFVSTFINLLSGVVVDFSFLKTFIHFVVNTTIASMLCVCVESNGQGKNLINYVIYAFLLQTIIQWICFIFPSIYEATNIFRMESDIYERYGGTRGLAISSSFAFTLAASYGLVAILFFSKYNTIFNNNLLAKAACFCFICSGTFFAGRTGYIGIIIALFAKLVNFFSSNHGKIVFSNKTLGIIIICILSILLVAGFIQQMKSIPIFDRLYKFTFELFINFFSGNGFSTTSSDQILGMYDLELSAHTLFLGDGKYWEIDGVLTYQNTDGGYSRPLLFFGLPGFLFLFVIQINLFFNKKEEFYSVIIFLYSLILQVKGEIIGFSIMYNAIIVFYSLTATKPFYVRNNSCFSFEKKDCQEVECNM